MSAPFCPTPRPPSLGTLPRPCRLAHLARRVVDFGPCKRFCQTSALVTGEGHRLMLNTLDLLHESGYSMSDIVYILAQAACQLDECFRLFRPGGQRERMLACLVHTFLAHCLLEDETLSLSTWYTRLATSYCSLSTFEKSSFRLLTLQSCRLYVADEIVLARAAYFRFDRRARPPEADGDDDLMSTGLTVSVIGPFGRSLPLFSDA
ncbi:unnamed protein product [Vitrella brassicaformis CCMP3155]|uniref:Cyclin N-terminal domain-containing protein n=1 Tax=Vitrella brassicaformis (strain CCMP3155) TaxID=1169540 RepID=A0A0G4GTQ5_VITBC|nr:unnamed protein product [Vitrella brassicaformis CCMP3155]|eukprot:CEM34101.1 unnamed protein product [Vitrella brassicaformis CCMP3155]